MKRNTKILFLGLFSIGLISVFGFRIWQVKRVKKTPFSPQKSTFVSEPPEEALIGELIEVSGQVEKEPRGKDEYEKIKVGEKIFQGEKLKTGEDSQATIEFAEFGQLSILSNTEIDFVNLIPTNFLVYQISGKTRYKLLAKEQSLSVRSLHLLYNLEKGEAEISTDEKEGQVVIAQLEGQGRLAMVDLENQTHVWEIKEGQVASINDGDRRVEIKKLLLLDSPPKIAYLGGSLEE